jgi:hypothetical protein
MLMSLKPLGWILLGLFVAVVAVIIAVSLNSDPRNEPAINAALTFVEAAARGDDATANALMSADLRAYVAANCPNGSVSACVDTYTPPEWGAFLSAVFRRGVPMGAEWDVDIIATWELDRGFSGVCIYTRMARNEQGVWEVVRYAGFAWCGDPNTRDMERNPAAPNQAPSASAG